MQKNKNRASAMLAVVTIAMCFAGSVAYAADPPAKTYQIGPQSVSAALKAFAAQSDMQLIFTEADVGKAKTPGVTGTKAPREALQEILKGTGLEFEFTANNVIVVRKTSPGTQNASLRSNDPSDNPKEAGKKTSPDFRVAQVDQGRDQKTSSVKKPDESADKNSKKQKDELEPYRVNTPEVLIVGSKVMNVDVKRTEDDVQPYTILDSTQIAQSGATNVEDFLKQRLTMDTTFLSNSQAYGSPQGATSTINLRGLGANETLILIDGRRSAGVTLGINTNQPDINGIPLSAIERIEVLPSSASAIYGGAAVGGVVNIVLKKTFEGGDLSYTYDNTFNASAPLRTVNATYGLSLEDGKTRIMLAGHYSDGQVLLNQDRLALTQRGIATIFRNSPSFLYNSSNPFQGATPNIAGLDANGNPTNLILNNGTPLNSPITSIPAGAAPGSNLSAGLINSAGTLQSKSGARNGRIWASERLGYRSPATSHSWSRSVREFTSSLEAFTEIYNQEQCEPHALQPVF